MSKQQQPSKKADHVEYTSFGKVNLSQNARDLASMVGARNNENNKSPSPAKSAKK
jgi:hypothetical protein